MFKNYIYPNDFPEFIGLKIEDCIPKFIFPYNYQKAENEDELKKDMLNLLKLIDRYKSEEKINDKYFKKNLFPFDAYLWIIRDYLNNGYYVSNKKEFIKNTRGKINWKKTIKNNDLLLNNENLIYRNFVVSHKNTIEDIISQIHKYCVYDAVLKMGWFFDVNINSVEKINLNMMNNSNMINILNEEYIKSFTDRKKTLLLNMIKLLKGLDMNACNTTSFDLSTNEFEYVFERLINDYFGTEDTKRFNPKTTWHIENMCIKGSCLRPDTILIREDTAYIIDAKFYKYGYTNNPKHLPDSSSIQKQIIYAENLENNNKDIKNIYNIFILPTSSTDEIIKYIGYADTTWLNNDIQNKSYSKIHTFVIDLKSLINNENNKISKILLIEEFINIKNSEIFN